MHGYPAWHAHVCTTPCTRMILLQLPAHICIPCMCTRGSTATLSNKLMATGDEKRAWPCKTQLPYRCAFSVVVTLALKGCQLAPLYYINNLPSQMSYNGGVLSTAPCDPTWTGTKRPISEATQSRRNCIKEARTCFRSVVHGVHARSALQFSRCFARAHSSSTPF